uniref:Zinc metalloproteinase n=1 Tax=Setaria digitata TaxID=48799 RepID=A0A915PLK9_9BILA
MLSRVITGDTSRTCKVTLVNNNAIINAQNDNIVSNDYAEVRVLLDKYYQIKARKHGHYHDYDSKKVNKELKDIPTDDGTEASINRKEGVVGDLFENDILLTLPQVKALLNEDIKSRSNRQAIRGAHYNWINMPISYRFANSDAKWQKVIRNALQHIETETCVRFEENGANQNYLYFTKGRGCWSNVGKIGGRQLISIGIGCELVGIVAHEVLHALGLWHEQSRSDRDNSIWINYFNIYPVLVQTSVKQQKCASLRCRKSALELLAKDILEKGTQGNFEKRTILDSDNMGLPYDFGSIMHYGSKAFTTDHKRYTIETRDRRYQETIGQRQMISFKDARMINLRYCGSTYTLNYLLFTHQMTCYNGGYTDPNNCYQCKCPSGLGGANCLSVEKSTDYDYRDIAFAGVRDNVHCIWRIRSNRRILVKVDELRLPCRETCDSYLELKYKADMIPTAFFKVSLNLSETVPVSANYAIIKAQDIAVEHQTCG